MINPSSSNNQPDRSKTGANYDTLKNDVSNLSQSVKAFAADKLGSTAADAQEQVQQTLGTVEARVRSNPIQSALIAAGVGLLVGLVLTR
jgi:ElaB/YqjD/DUF883 family membrane-anchored ribosome-binding protein